MANSTRSPSTSPSAITKPEIVRDLLAARGGDCLALVIAWSAREPERVGEVALLSADSPLYILGRAPDHDAEIGNSNGCAVTFFRQRPPREPDDESDGGSCYFEGETLSRRQLAISPRERSLIVKNIGRCELLYNGQPATEVEVHPGDTLHLRNQLLLYCTRRFVKMPALKSYPQARIGSFGHSDQDDMVGESPLMWRLRDQLAACARTNFHVLVIGESGSGKELAAQAVHRLSRRAGNKLVADNIAAIPPTLAAALLFGNKKNFPNPGMEERIGLIGQAHGSTLFLDEIGDMPEEVQPLFLRVTERNGDYFRLGEENRLQRSDFRLVGATNRPDKMRHELKRRFQREIRVPGLNQRKEDIPLLIRHLLIAQAHKDDIDALRFLRGSQPRVHPLFVEQLLHHTYRTHVSEVAFLLGQSMADSDDDIIGPLGNKLRVELPQPAAAERPIRHKRPLPTLDLTQETLDAHNGNVTRAARALNISRDQLNRLITREGLVVQKSNQFPSARQSTRRSRPAT